MFSQDEAVALGAAWETQFAEKPGDFNDLGKWVVDWMGRKGRLPQPADTKPVLLQQHQLRFPVFSGDEKDSSFEVWRHQVKSAINNKVHSDFDLQEAMQRSLKGDAANIVVNMGEEVTPKQILDKLAVVFESVELGQGWLTEFHSAFQKEAESVAKWSVRLEGLLVKAISSGLVCTWNYGLCLPRFTHQRKTLTSFESKCVN